MNQWKKLEVSLLVGLAAALLFGGRLSSTQAALAGKMIRLHVVAHSDRPQDQAVKLCVRDQVLAEMNCVLADVTDLTAAREAITAALPRLEAVGQDAVEDAGCAYSVKASLEETFFPTKEYEGFALPAGDYTALRIVLGDGAGANWWCVLFPPLCTGVATEDVAATAQAAGMTEPEIALITERDEGYVFRFKCIEWWEKLKHFFS